MTRGFDDDDNDADANDDDNEMDALADTADDVGISGDNDDGNNGARTVMGRSRMK